MDAKIKAGIDTMIKAKKTKAQITGYMLMEGVSEKEIKDTLRSMGMVRTMGGFRDILYAELAKGPLTEAMFKQMIAKATANSKKHESHYWGIVELANKIHASLKPGSNHQK